MISDLHYSIASPLLLKILKIAMKANELKHFRLVGGTALSLYRGHRESADLDLFTDSPYGSIDFGAIDNFFHKTFPYVDASDREITGPGRSYFAGSGKNDCLKVDVFYSDENFIREVKLIDILRIADIEDIIAMKLDVITRGGRKKDYWDIHELIDDYSFETMVSLHRERYPYSHDPGKIKTGFSDFEKADNDFDPVCLKGKYWELIKLDLLSFSGC